MLRGKSGFNGEWSWGRAGRTGGQGTPPRCRVGALAMVGLGELSSRRPPALMSVPGVVLREETEKPPSEGACYG